MKKSKELSWKDRERLQAAAVKRREKRIQDLVAIRDILHRMMREDSRVERFPIFDAERTLCLQAASGSLSKAIHWRRK